MASVGLDSSFTSVKNLEIKLFTDCKGQNNIGSVLQYLEEVVSSYSSKKDIIANEIIYISKYGYITRKEFLNQYFTIWLNISESTSIIDIELTIMNQPKTKKEYL